MDKAEAKKILSEKIRELKRSSFQELSQLTDKKNIKTQEVIGKSGTKYQLEIQAMWDDKPGETLRIMVSIDDFGFRAFYPMTQDFIITPDGSLVDE